MDDPGPKVGGEMSSWVLVSLLMNTNSGSEEVEMGRGGSEEDDGEEGS